MRGSARSWSEVRIFRVGKANTLLVVPNDWSTLTNGTVDGLPTGLHRYVGENRFVFGLLNVTDGKGDLASYDLESKKTYGIPYYIDESGNTVVSQGDRGRVPPVQDRADPRRGPRSPLVPPWREQRPNPAGRLLRAEAVREAGRLLRRRLEPVRGQDQ